MKRVTVRAGGGAYAVLCGRGLLKSAEREVAALGPSTGVYLLSSPRVWKDWGRKLERHFHASRRATILFDDRETAKNLATVERIARQLVRAGADRQATIVAVGGGVVGDVAGFVAATYARGVSLVHVPTTLVGQVDSAIGGKTGVNLPEGKNLIGAFYPPRLVLADPETLRTLPPREYRCGIFEVIKYGVIGDAPLFRFLEDHLERVVHAEPAAVEFVLQRSIAQKAKVVSRDEHESGLREILNFGHTFAHALESVTRYRKYLHGEAVGWGMIAAAHAAEAAGLWPEREAERLQELVRRTAPLPRWPTVPRERILAAMFADKKTRGGRLRFVLPERIGKVRCGVELERSIVLEALRRCARMSA